MKKEIEDIGNGNIGAGDWVQLEEGVILACIVKDQEIGEPIYCVGLPVDQESIEKEYHIVGHHYTLLGALINSLVVLARESKHSIVGEDLNELTGNNILDIWAKKMDNYCYAPTEKTLTHFRRDPPESEALCTVNLLVRDDECMPYLT